MLERLRKLKHVVVEPRDGAALGAAVDEYMAAVKGARGGVLLAVCRGKLSEGVDFSDAGALLLALEPQPPLRCPVPTARAMLPSAVRCYRLPSSPALRQPCSLLVGLIVAVALAACRGVVIAGLPLPPIFDAQVVLKKSFLDSRRRVAGASRGRIS